MNEMIETALRRVNQAREATGRTGLADLRRGARCTPGACPLAASLDSGSVQVQYGYVVFETEKEANKVRAAWGVSAWHGPFDEGVPACAPEDELYTEDEYRARSVVLPDDIVRFPNKFDMCSVTRDPELLAYDENHERVRSV